MKVMVMVKATDSSEAGELPDEKLLTEMGSFNEKLVQAGIMKAGEGLKPSSEGVRVRFSGSERIVTDGPFVETKELVAGYWIWEVSSFQEAIDWVKQCPNPMKEDSEIEIRRLYEMEDFAENDPNGLVADSENKLRSSMSAQSGQIDTYLFFGGRCEEALEFYQQALGAQITMVMRFKESPEPVPEDMVPPNFDNKIMHCEFRIGSTNLMASDGCSTDTEFDGFQLALQVPTEADADRVFDALALEGAVNRPLEKTFWSPRYGQVTDKFGIGWMVMVPGQPPN